MKGNNVQGTVKRVMEEKGFGFIAQQSGIDVFFHKRDLDKSVPFDESLVGKRVEFRVITGDRGPKAESIRVVT